VVLCLDVDAADYAPRLIDDATDAPEVARVVEGHAASVLLLLDLRQLALLLQLREYLGVVEDLEIAATVVAVLLAQGVEAVRAGGDDSLDSELLEGLDVGLG